MVGLRDSKDECIHTISDRKEFELSMVSVGNLPAQTQAKSNSARISTASGIRPKESFEKIAFRAEEFSSA
jgi:hypothetical protein